LKECINIPVQREEFRREFVDEELIEAIKNSINEESQNERPHNQEG